MSTVIKVLDGLEHIRKRPSMWIGHNLHPTHLFREVLDNAIDEIINGYGNTITVDYDLENSIAVVTDNGRGFPIEEVTLPNGEKIDSVIAATCYVFSGGKFDDQHYDISRGTHGVGLSAVNALSNYLTFTIKNKNQFLYYKFVDGQFVEKKILDQQFDFSTRVEFQPNPKYFKSNQFQISEIINLLKLISTIDSNFQIFINKERLKNISLEHFARELLNLRSDDPLYHLKFQLESEKVEVYFTFIDSTSISTGEVNLGLIYGGTAFDNFKNLVYSCIKNIYGSNIRKQEALTGLRFFISLRLKNASYSSQDKKHLTKTVNYLIDKLEDQLVKKFHLTHLKEFFQERFSNKQLKLASKLITKKKNNRVSQENPLKDCQDIPGNILYIIEGESAEGTLKAIRNVKNEAILPINGKILNTKNLDFSNIVNLITNKNSKFKYILEAIGVNLDPDQNQDQFRYNLVKVICDADPDGLHISILVSIAIWKFAPRLIEQGRFKIILPPLYGANKKGKPFVPIYRLEDVDKYKQQGYTITRFKGLGEMNPSELAAVLANPVEYTPRLPVNEKEVFQLNQLLNNSDLKRKICEEVKFSLEYFISKTIGANRNEELV